MRICLDYDEKPLQNLYRDIKLPEFKNYTRQTRHRGIADLEKVLAAQLKKLDPFVLPGMSVAIAVGSRGIDGIDTVVKAAVEYLKQKSARPYIVAAMGSHGGATSEGQRHVLAGYGITEERMGADILTSMEAENIGSGDDDIPAFMSSDALKADKILLINRIKAHTDFTGRHESGLMKLIAIGLGKHKGALACHSDGFINMPRNIERIAGKLLGLGKVMGGIALVENELHQTCRIEVIPSSDIPEREARLLKYAKSTMGLLPFSQLDALVVLKCGKEISGAGIDPNVIGRKPRDKKPSCKIDFVVCSDLTDKSEGNAIGIGNADIICKRAADKIDLAKTYLNGVTSRGLIGARIPMIVGNDEEAIKLCMFLCDKSAENIRMACIRDTNSVDSIYISPALAEEANSISCLKHHKKSKLILEQGYIKI